MKYIKTYENFFINNFFIPKLIKKFQRVVLDLVKKNYEGIFSNTDITNNIIKNDKYPNALIQYNFALNYKTSLKELLEIWSEKIKYLKIEKEIDRYNL